MKAHASNLLFVVHRVSSQSSCIKVHYFRASSWSFEASILLKVCLFWVTRKALFTRLFHCIHWHFVGLPHAYLHQFIASLTLMPHLLLWLFFNTAVYIICIDEQTQEQGSILDTLFWVGLISIMLSTPKWQELFIFLLLLVKHLATYFSVMQS